MAAGTTKAAIIRRTLIVIALLGLIAMFFALNYFLFIPRQQQRYHKKIFRILQEASDDFKKRLQEDTSYFIKNGIRTDNDEQETLSLTAGDTLAPALKIKFNASFTGFTRTDEIRNKQFSYRPDSIRFTIDTGGVPQDTSFGIGHLLEPTLQDLHKNIFELVMLVKRELDTATNGKISYSDHLLYKFGTLAAGPLLDGDSLFGNGRSLRFAAIHDITIEGNEYKAFSLPFESGGEELILIGFISEDNYRFTTMHYSYSALLLIGGLLVLIIISLPFIKIFVLSRHERITVNDVRMLIVVMIITPFILILASSSIHLYKYADDKIDRELDDLQHTVTVQFEKEIGEALRQLQEYDTLIKSAAAFQTTKHVYDSLLGAGYPVDFKNLFLYPSIYPNLDDVFWVNADGKQIAKWFFLDRKVSYLDLSERNFFKNMRDDRAFLYPFKDTFPKEAYYIEPTISWATGEYSVNILRKSNVDFSGSTADASKKAIMIGLASRMYSISDPVLPKGFNFCIIDDKGNILYHSQTSRSLHENLFAECNYDYDLINAVDKRTQILIPSIQLYDRTVKMREIPIPGLPYYFVGYFNKREQNLFILHIASFTLLCVSITLFLLLVFMVLHYVAGVATSEPTVFTYESGWMKPLKERKPFYKLIFVQELVTALLIFIFFLIVPKKQEHWYVLQACILLPFFITAGYYLLKNEYDHQKENSHYWTRNLRTLLLYGITMVIFGVNFHRLLYAEEKGHTITDIAVVLLMASVPVTAFFSTHLLQAGRWLVAANFMNRAVNFFRNTIYRPRGNYINLFTGIILLSILLISVVPTLGFLNYAVKEEFRTQIKSGQYYAAQQIDQRRIQMNQYLASTRMHAPGKNEDSISHYIARRKLSSAYGIYLFRQRTVLDTVNLRLDKPHAIKSEPDQSHFYQVITKFLFLPKDHEDFFFKNNLYYWIDEQISPGNNTTTLIYENQSDRQTEASVKISTPFDSNYMLVDIFVNHFGWFVFICTLLFLFFYYQLIRSVIKRIFLLDYFEADETNDPGSTWVDKYYNTVTLTVKDKDFLGMSPAPFPSVLTSKVIEDKENMCKKNLLEERENMLRIQYLLTPAYDAIWKDLKNEEKFILYDFAIDGFTNYRNADMLYRLYQKGLIKKRKPQLELMHYSFRNYLMGKVGEEEITQLKQQLHIGSTWKNIKIIFYILFLAVMIFLFSTQQEVSNKILAIVSGLVTLVPLLLKVFDKNPSPGGPATRDDKA